MSIQHRNNIGKNTIQKARCQRCHSRNDRQKAFPYIFLSRQIGKYKLDQVLVIKINI